MRSKAAKPRKSAKAIIDGKSSQLAIMKVSNDPSVDWEGEGAYHCDSSIALLMETMQRDQNESLPQGRYPSSHVRTARSRSV